jgi:hypothetical protein
MVDAVYSNSGFLLPAVEAAFGKQCSHGSHVKVSVQLLIPVGLLRVSHNKTSTMKRVMALEPLAFLFPIVCSAFFLLGVGGCVAALLASIAMIRDPILHL